ncbi:MAG: TolB family protein, partial [Nocardioidaceae bacterium]
MRPVPFGMVVLLAACGGSDINQPTAGSVRVTATTTGDRPDADGYAAVLDGGAGRALGIGGTVTFSEVEAGDHDLMLEGIAPNCAVDGDNPVGLVVSAGATEVVAFAIACSAELTRLEVSTATTGASPDPDGYTVQIDGAAGQPIGANAALTITGLTAGVHTVRLSDIAPNCRVTGPNPTEVSLVPAEAAQVAFAIECPVPTGSIEATVVTLGFAAEFDGYTLSVDGDAGHAIDRNGTVTFSGLGPGRHTVLLAGIASNCLLDGENPRVVEVASLTTTALALQVACRVPVSDQILFSSDRSTVFPFSHVYRMRADGSEVVDLTPGADGEDGAWSPDGTRIAFTSYRDGNAEI